jgi:hypothetical protein
MGKTSWNGQIYRALKAIDHTPARMRCSAPAVPQAVSCGTCVGASKYVAKQAQGWKPGEAVAGLYSFGTFKTVFRRAITYTNWLGVEYPVLRFFKNVDHEMTAEFLSEKAETCQADTVQTLVSTLRKLQEGCMS